MSRADVEGWLVAARYSAETARFVADVLEGGEPSGDSWLPGELRDRRPASTDPDEIAQFLKECVKVAWGALAAYGQAGRVAARQQDLGAIERRGVALRLVWDDSGPAAGVWLLSTDSIRPTFRLPAAVVPRLVEVVDGLLRTSGHRTEAPEREDLAVLRDAAGIGFQVDVVRGDDAATLYVGPSGRSAVRVDWRDLPAFLSMLRKAGELAAARRS